MIGIIAAMTVEVDGLKALMLNENERQIGGMNFCFGQIHGKDVVITTCCDGKVNAAMCAQIMILEFKADMIINTGVAGGLDKNLKVCDIVVANSVCEHDYDLTPLGYKIGYVLGVEDVYINCDERIVEALDKAVSKNKLNHIVGRIATGDQFICSTDKQQWLIDTFDAVACEMEGGAVGHVCKRNNIPFGVLRAMSDSGDDDASMSFNEFIKLASGNSISVMSDFIDIIEI